MQVYSALGNGMTMKSISFTHLLVFSFLHAQVPYIYIYSLLLDVYYIQQHMYIQQQYTLSVHSSTIHILRTITRIRNKPYRSLRIRPLLLRPSVGIVVVVVVLFVGEMCDDPFAT